jgi:hypothetical protein
MTMDPDNVSGSIVIGAPMLACMTEKSDWRSGVKGELSPVEYALILASLKQLRGEAEQLLRRADSLTARTVPAGRLPVAPVAPGESSDRGASDESR